LHQTIAEQFDVRFEKSVATSFSFPAFELGDRAVASASRVTAVPCRSLNVTPMMSAAAQALRHDARKPSEVHGFPSLLKPAWRPRKEACLSILPGKPRESLLVSLADKTHNAEAILFDYRVLGDRLWERFNGGADGTRWYYSAVAEVFSKAMPRPAGGPAFAERERFFGLSPCKHSPQLIGVNQSAA